MGPKPTIQAFLSSIFRFVFTPNPAFVPELINDLKYVWIIEFTITRLMSIRHTSQLHMTNDSNVVFQEVCNISLQADALNTKEGTASTMKHCKGPENRALTISCPQVGGCICDSLPLTLIPLSRSRLSRFLSSAPPLHASPSQFSTMSQYLSFFSRSHSNSTSRSSSRCSGLARYSRIASLTLSRAFLALLLYLSPLPPF